MPSTEPSSDPASWPAMRASILARYDAEMRDDPPPFAGVLHERIGPLVRATGVWNVVQSTRLREDEAAAAVAEQAAYARRTGTALEWKVYDHDGPPALTTLLQAAGFVADERETFMVYDLDRAANDGALAALGVDVRRVSDARGVDDYVAVNAAAFGREFRLDPQTYLRSLDDPALALFVAYLDDAPAAAGRLQTPQGRAFAGMWGGGTVPAHRRKGIYRAIVAARAAEARRRGFRYVTVDARATSRPILERVGFEALVGVTGWVLRPAVSP